MKKLFGYSLHEGIVSGNYFFLEFQNDHSKSSSKEEELKRLQLLFKELENEYKEKRSNLLDLHLMILSDKSFIDEIEKNIDNNLSLENSIKSLYNKYFQNRDEVKKNSNKYDFFSIADICKKMLQHLIKSEFDFSGMDDKILIAKEMTVSQFLQIVDKKINIRGIILGKNARNSYLSSLVKSFGIPTLIDVNLSQHDWKSNEHIILDSRCGFETIFIEPSEKNRLFYERSLEKIYLEKEALLKYDNENCSTQDGKQIFLDLSLMHFDSKKLLENITYNDLGVLKTEIFFVMHETLPNQEEQLRQYKTFIPYFANKNIGIMLANFNVNQQFQISNVLELDSLASKLQGSRFLLHNLEFLKAQIKAILRLSSFINVKIIYPFVTNTNEIIQLNKILENSKDELINEGYVFNENIKVSCCVETPASAVISDRIIDLVDEIIIDLDMLTQYVLIADRSDRDIDHIFDSLDPSVLRTIKMVVDAANNKGKKVSVFGELAHSEIGIVALLVLGIRNIALAPKYLAMAKRVVSKINLSKLDELRNYILNSASAENNRSIANLFVNDLLEKNDVEKSFMIESLK